MAKRPDALWLTTLGRLSLRDASGEVLIQDAKPLLVLALLVSRSSGEISREHLSNLLWPEATPARRKRSLRQALHSLRKTGAASAMLTEGERVRLDGEGIDCDLWRVGSLFEADRHEEVVDLYAGPFLDSMRAKMPRELRRWAEAEDARLQVVVDDCFERTVQRHADRGEWDRAASTARAWLAMNPLSERRVGLLADLLRTAGRPTLALQELQRLRSLLLTELGDVPSETLREMEVALRAEIADERSDHGLASGPGGAESGGSPMRESEKPSLSKGSGNQPTGPRPRRHLLGPSLVMAGALVILASLIRAGPRLSSADTGDVGRLGLDPDAVALLVRAVQENDGIVRSPVRAEWAHYRTSPTGTDLVVADSSGQTRTILASPADEHPLDWSPDGERLLYWRGRYHRADNTYRVHLGTWDRDTDAFVEWPVPDFDGAIQASWSPDGSRIAVGGGPALLVMTPDGPVTVKRGDALRVGEPRWAPSGRRIAVPVWDGTPADVFVFDEDSGRLQRVVRTVGHETDVVWVTDRYLLARSELGGEAHLVLIDVDRARVAVLQGQTDIVRLRDGPIVGVADDRLVESMFEQLRASPRAAYIDSIVIRGGADTLGLGEHVVFAAVPLDGDRGPLLDAPTLPAWEARRGLLEMVGEGHLRARSLGTEELMVAVPGWRSSALDVVVATVERRPVAPALEEHWDTAWSERWRPYGDPRPRVRDLDADEVFPRAFEARGDQNYASGIMSTRAFSTVEGITVEVWSRAAFSQPLFQSWTVGFIQDRFDEIPEDRFSAMSGQAWASFMNRHRQTLVRGMDAHFRIPLPDSMDHWRRYAFQVTPDGEQRVLVDGRMHVRVPPPPDWVPGDSVRVLLSGQDINAEILKGPLAVYEGALYGLATESRD